MFENEKNGEKFDKNTFLRARKKCIKACLETYKETAHAWKKDHLKGKDLFSFASQKAVELGYELNPLMAGHRLGDFPHRLFSSDKLFDLDRSPTENLWVLEIHLVDKANNQGAFFEDLLF